MPESIPSLPDVRCFALEEFTRERVAPESASKSQCYGRRTSPIRINGDRTQTRGRRARTNSTERSTGPPPHPPSRKPGSSIYYGVRFRPDLNKWVAEIRVAEWKAVDKKVWLGTFDTEKGAARGVDLARKLLKCKKKHGFNLPCPELDSYSGQIPASLILTDVTASSMFKTATLFIKRECQLYAASFHDSDSRADSSAGSSLLHPDPHSPGHYFHPPPASMLTHIAYPSQANSFDSEIMDDAVHDPSSDSDHESSMMPEELDYNYVATVVDSESISINDYLNDEYHLPMSMGRSPSSCTSTMSCMTFEHVVHDQQCMDRETEIAEFGDVGSCIVATRMIQGEMQGGIQGAVSQECWAEVSCTWPGPGSSSAALAPLPGSYYDMTPYMSYMDCASMDCDDLTPDLSFQNFHNYPSFQNGSNRWC